MYIRMPEGYDELGIEGHSYKADEDGLFDIPPQWADYYIKCHGAKRELSLAELQQGLAAMEKQFSETKLVYDAQIAALAEARKQVAEYTAKRNAAKKAKIDAQVKSDTGSKDKK